MGKDAPTTEKADVKISELIARLQAEMALHGDRKVVVFDDRTECTPCVLSFDFACAVAAAEYYEPTEKA